ncbi:MAG: sensor histidine kinase [Actinomycetota bacterium]
MKRRQGSIAGALGAGEERAALERARWHLWGATFAVMLALVGSVLVLSRDPTLQRAIDRTIPFLPAGRLKAALVLMVIIFLVYVIDRERNLRKMSERIIGQALEKERLAAQLEYLSELQNERDTNAALLEGAADGIAVVGRDHRLLRFNAAMEDLTGVPAETAIGSFAPAVLRFLASDGHPLNGDQNPISSAFRGLPASGVELVLQVSDGTERWVGATISPIGADGDEAEFVLVIVRDISEMKEVQDLQRDFVSIVSHELRTPLTAIKGFASMLVQKGDRLEPTTRTGFLSTINSQSDRLAKLVDDLLQVSKIEARRLHIEADALDGVALIEKLLPQFDSKWHRMIQLDAPCDLPLVEADRSKLEEVLINLIDNAVKYSPEGSPIRVSISARENEIEFSVSDQGAGFSPVDAARLFQKFQRLSTPATRDVGGSGLGLYIVKSLIDAMRGRIWVESAPGAGATFTFTLPRASGEVFQSSHEQVSA